MAGVTRAEATAQVRRTIGAYRDRVHEVRNDTDRLPPEGARIVDEYCSFDNDWQDLVQDAVREASFLGGMDDGLLLEYCAVCMELDDALGLGSWHIGRVDRIIGVADLSRSEKIRKAIEYSDILGEILEEVGDINALVAQMVAVSGVLIGLAATGYGAAAEVLGLALLVVGASFSGTDLLAGIAGLVKFFTMVDDAKSEDDLKACGKLFGDAVAKIGVNGLFFVLSLFGLKKASIRHTTRTIAESNPVSGKWERKSFKENVLKIGEGKNKSVDSNAIPKVSLQFNETRCHDHLIYGDGIKPGQSGVNGAHNKNNFYKTINDKFEPVFNKEGLKFNINECIENRTAHPTISGIEEIRYKLPAMNQNNTLKKGLYKKVRAPKTVYDPSVISDEKMIQWGKEAMENGNIINGRIVEGISKNGLKFRGFLSDNGEITNFFPLMDN